MSTWLAALIGMGVVVLVVGVGYVVWRWGTKKAAITGTVLSVMSGVLSVLKDFFHDNPDKLDAHDFIAASADISKALGEILKKYQPGASMELAKTEMVAAVKAVRDKFPGLKDALSDELVEKEVSAALTLIFSIPKVGDAVKK